MTFKLLSKASFAALGAATILLTGCQTRSTVNTAEPSVQNTISQELNEKDSQMTYNITSNTTDLSQEEMEAIIDLYNRMKDAMIKADIETLEDILPDDYEAVHISGRRQSKEEWLADIESGQMVYYDFLDSSYGFSQENDQIILTVSQRIHAHIYGSEGTWSVPGQRYFRKIKGEWRLMA